MERKKKVAEKVKQVIAKQTTLSDMFTPKTSLKDEEKNASSLMKAEEMTEKTMDATPKTPGTGNGRFVRLPREFFKQEVVQLSRALLGKVIRRNVDGKILRCRIVETEAYKAPEDKACHAYNNKKTERTKAFWCDAGSWYVYTIYMKTNMCLNVVAVDKDTPEAALIRAGEPLEGIGEMQKYRNMMGKNKPAEIRNLTNGPGKLGMAMNFGLHHSTHDMCAEDYEEAYIEDDLEYEVKDEDVVITKRINIDYAAEYKDKPWRFYIKGNPYVSQK